jgi:hypothetical protein
MTDAPIGAAVDLTAPLTPAEAAAAKIIELKNTPAWVQQHLAGSHETKAELARLHSIVCQPAAGSIIDGGPSPEAQWGQVADHLEAVGDLSAAVIQEIREGKPASQEEFRLATNRKQARMADPKWVANYLNNGAEERREMLLLNSIISRGMRLA